MRTTADGYAARRQVIFFKPATWLVLDEHMDAGTGSSVTSWTVSHDIAVDQAGTPDCYFLRSKTSTKYLESCFLGIEGTTVKKMRGSWDPFSGWEVVNGSIKSSTSFVVTSVADHAWSAAVWVLHNNRQAGMPKLAPSMG